MTTRLWPALLFLLAASCRAPEPFSPPRRDDLARAITKDWSQEARLAAASLMQKYGPPDAVAAGALAWKDRAPWRRIVIWDQPLGAGIEETVGYDVPGDRKTALGSLKGLVEISADGSELSAQTNSEETNFLALNIADKLVRGTIRPSEARPYYERTLRLAASGKSSADLQSLRFPTEAVVP